MKFSCVNVEEVTQHVAVHTLDYSISFPENIRFTRANNKDVSTLAPRRKANVFVAAVIYTQ